jgi:NAD(P)H-nitrite reductase large subunit
LGNVTRLYHCEDVRLDRDRLRILAADLGEIGAERVIGRAIEEIAVRLTRIENAYAEGDVRRVAKGARSLIAIADQTGLSTVRDIAADVTALCSDDSGAALGACVSRLIRVGEMSLVTIWDVHDVSL